MRRSMLFLPGNAPNMILSGDCLGADAIILATGSVPVMQGISFCRSGVVVLELFQKQLCYR